MGAIKNIAIDELHNFKSQASDLLKDYSDKFESIDNRFSKLSNYEKVCQEIYDKTVQLKETIDRFSTDIKQTRDEILVDPSDKEYSILNYIKASQEKITDIFDKVTNYHKELFGYRKKVRTPISEQQYNAIKSPNEKELKDGKYFQISYTDVPGEKDEINELITQYNAFLKKDEDSVKERENKVDERVSILLKKIEGLLPGATAAGLSESYYKAQNSARQATWLWIACFIFSIGISGYIGWLMFDKGILVFNSEMTLFGSIIQILRVLCFEFPFIWLAWTANIKISQYMRLTEEYRHKWAMMRIFDGMRSIINENDSKEAETSKDQFYNYLLISFSENPSKSLDKKYKVDGPFSVVTDTMNKILTKKSKAKQDFDKSEKQ